MIVDKIENSSLYFKINERIEKALNVIQQTDFTQYQPGRHEIDGKIMYAIVQEYETKNTQDGLLEAHRNYIDVQYVFEGEEQVGVATLENQQEVKAYNVNDDYLLYKDKYSLISLKKGMFAVFFPDDLHLPGITSGKISKVKKVVVKVKI